MKSLLPEDLQGKTVLGDGAYHTKNLHRQVQERGGTLLSPPKADSVRWGRTPTHDDEQAFRASNSAVQHIRAEGRLAWKRRSGYHQHSFVESTMHRFKALTGDRLAARRRDTQEVEVRLRCKLLNRASVPAAQAYR